MSETPQSYANASPRTLRVSKSSVCAKAFDRRGFTMMELLAVIAILAILAVIAFVFIGNIQRNAQQAELDGTAKELFIAAQNHLTAAEAQGVLDRKADRGVEDSDEPGVYYYAVGGAETRAILDPSSSAHDTGVLYQMLPFGSIDETVRTDGTYVVKYNYDTATVVGVFYARSSYSSLFAANTEGFVFVDGDYTRLFDNPGYTGQDRKQARQDYVSVSGQTVMVGYYGGEDIELLAGDQLSRPVLRVVNSERLTAIVKNANYGIDQGKAAGERLNQNLQLIVTGETSGKSKAITLVNNGTTNTAAAYVESPDGGRTFYVFLDDITVRGGHFAEIFGTDGLIPGENITVQAVTSSNSKLTNVASSAKLYRNSLFASVSRGATLFGTIDLGSDINTVTDSSSVVRIGNIRHLENLSSNVSGYNPASSVWRGSAPTAAIQTRDLSWTDFQARIARPVGETVNQTAAIDDATRIARAQVAASVRTVELYTYSGAVEEGSFMPVSPQFNLVYDGRSHRISDVLVICNTGNVGVFGDLNGADLHDLSIVNCSVATTTGDAGALAGQLSGDSVTMNVAAFNEADENGGFRSQSTDAALGVTGSASVGGLVGSMRGGTVQNCAAAVYVRSLGGSAGGLVGWTDGEVVIDCSYAGGHTVEGAYSTSIATGEVGRVNVIAAVNAGGLVGNAASATSLAIANCYSTASVYGGDPTGGLVGYLNSGSIVDSYSVAAVSAAEGVATGVFVGGTGGTVAFSDNTYLDLVNDAPQMNSFGTGAGEAVAADASIDNYAAFADGSSTAYPYDAALMPRYRNMYPFKTVAELVGLSDLPLHSRTHFGDWPALETLVVNVPS